MSFEESLVWHASPTLASLKVANMYTYHFCSRDECIKTIERFNYIMNPKGIYIELLSDANDLYLIYVYRMNQLANELSDKKIKSFLNEYGYQQSESLHDYIKILKNRFTNNRSFPHEIGVFLGYPLPDVISFIEKQGRNSIMCGDWKVYHDEKTARYLFGIYKHCREMYIKTYEAGYDFRKMLVGA